MIKNVFAYFAVINKVLFSIPNIYGGCHFVFGTMSYVSVGVDRTAMGRAESNPVLMIRLVVG